ncbi:MAG: hypothetical protein ACR2GU_04165 [Rubrobacteraceae bacterium]
MTKYVIGAVGALLGFLGGIWLVLAPFALGYQATGDSWTNATRNDVWFGIGLAIVSIIGFILYTLSLLRDLREKSIIAEEKDSPEQPMKSRATLVSSPQVVGGDVREGDALEPAADLSSATMLDDAPQGGQTDEVMVEQRLHQPNNYRGGVTVGASGSRYLCWVWR